MKLKRFINENKTDAENKKDQASHQRFPDQHILRILIIEPSGCSDLHLTLSLYIE
jgi:hypothetical protein